MGMKFHSGLGIAGLATGLVSMAAAATPRRHEGHPFDDIFIDDRYYTKPSELTYKNRYRDDYGYYGERPKKKSFTSTDIHLVIRALEGDIANIPQNPLAKGHGKGMSKRAKRRNRR